MTIYTNSADQTGLAVGTAVTTANSGGGTNTAFSVVAGTITVDNANPAPGHTEDYAVAASTAIASHVRISTATTTSIAGQFWFYLTGLPSSTTQWLFLGTGNYLNLTSTGTITVDANATNVHTSPTLSLNTWYCVDFGVTVAASGATINFALYNASGTTIDSYSTTSGNTGTTSAGSPYFGKHTSTGNLAAFDMGGIKTNDASSALFGPPTSPPTAAFSVTGQSALTVNVDGTASTAVSPATITGYDWNWGDGTTHGTGSTASHTYSTGGTYTITLTVTDSNGQTGTATTSVTVSAASGTVVPQSVDVSTGWTPSSGTALSCISDGDPTTFVTSSAPPTGQEFDFTLHAVTPPTSGQPFKVFLTIDAPLSTSASLNAQLGETVAGSFTQRSALTGVAVAAGSGGSVTNVAALTFPWTDVQNMTTGGWNAPRVKLQVSAS